MCISRVGKVRVREGECQEDTAKVDNSDFLFLAKIYAVNQTTHTLMLYFLDCSTTVSSLYSYCTRIATPSAYLSLYAKCLTQSHMVGIL